jgi:hypothetical protein
MLPWITYNAISWLDEYLNSGIVMFEYGSGESTLYFTEKVKKVISVEHDLEWHDKVYDDLEKYKVKNCDYFYIPPEKLNEKKDYFVGSYSSKNNKYKKYSFEEYARFIEIYSEKFFDFVFIDGRSRASCIKHALNRVKDNGYIMLDNSDRGHYACILSYMDIYDKQDFPGMGRDSKEWNTTIWKINRNG